MMLFTIILLETEMYSLLSLAVKKKQNKTKTCKILFLNTVKQMEQYAMLCYVIPVHI